MSSIPIYQVDAFTDRLFSGNPAAVCLFNQWPDNKLMQNIAAENNLAETAFIIPKGENYRLRWFTPTTEVDLCGHATMAAAHVLFEHYNHPSDKIKFESKNSGTLTVRKAGDVLTLDFPADIIAPAELPPALRQWLGEITCECYKGKTDYLIILETEREVKDLNINLQLISQVSARGVIVSAPGNEVDFVSRFFAPQCGVGEDPVTGSAHTTLTPYWSERLGKKNMTARQISLRGGTLSCADKGDRIEISGKAVTYLTGTIAVTGL